MDPWKPWIFGEKEHIKYRREKWNNKNQLEFYNRYFPLLEIKAEYFIQLWLQKEYEEAYLQEYGIEIPSEY